MFFEVRDFKQEDGNLILSTFLKGLYYGDSWFSLIPKDIFMKHYKPVILALLQKATVKVACLPDDKDIVLGYSILSSDFTVIHYVYVKSSWRKQGIAKALLPQYPTAVTHLTDVGRQLLPKFKDCVFNPFAL